MSRQNMDYLHTYNRDCASGCFELYNSNNDHSLGKASNVQRTMKMNGSHNYRIALASSTLQ